MNNCKTFYKAQTASRVKEIVQISPTTPHPPPDKSLLRLWNKNFLTETYKNIQTFAFQVLRDCNSCASTNEAVQMFFLTLSDVCWKICKVKKVSGCVAGAYFFQC